MNKKPFRWVFLPYCIQRLEDGRYIVLNRRYKPLGVSSAEWVVYEEHPSAVKMKITPKIAEKLSWEGHGKTDVIFLYNDGSIPSASDEHLKAYSERLRVLMEMPVEASE